LVKGYFDIVEYKVGGYQVLMDWFIVRKKPLALLGLNKK